MSQEEQNAESTQQDTPSPEASAEPTPVQAEASEAPATDESTQDEPQAEAGEQPPAKDSEDASLEQESDGETTDSSSADEAASSEEDESSSKRRSQKRGKRSSNRRQAPSVPDVKSELERLFELATKYPEVGAPLARLAMKIGYQGIGERLIKMQLDSEIEARGVEFFRVSAELARKEGRSTDVFTHVLEGMESVKSRGDDVPSDERTRLLHLVRLGFVVLLFDHEDLRSAPEFTDKLLADFPELATLYPEDPFYHTLLAQTLWFAGAEQSEEAWEKAVALHDAETTWNSRGTWYKEADSDLARAEWAYRSGLKALPTSTLLRHNLAQVLMDRAQNEGAEVPQIRSWLGESEALLRQALRHARRHGMRRHINGNIERVKALQADLPKVEEVIEPPPAVGDVVRGRVRSFKNYGVFLALGKHYSGLLHISEIAHERIQDPGQVLKMGDMIEVKVLSVEQRDEGEGLRIALSRKAILPVPEGGAQQDASSQDERPRRERRRNRDNRGGNKRGGGQNKRSRGQQNRGGNSGGSNKSGQRDNNQNMGSLGEMLLAKLEEKQNKS